METQDKELLIKDLCARLLYGIVCSIYGDNSNGVKLCGIKSNKCYFEDLDYKEGDGYVSIENVKPYLRPMSSMTEKEKEEYCDLQAIFLYSSRYPVTDAYALFDWLNAHHFDFRGLIPMGLALPAPKDMYNV